MFSSLKFKTGILASFRINKQEDSTKGNGKEKERKGKEIVKRGPAYEEKRREKGKMERKLSQAASLRDDC